MRKPLDPSEVSDDHSCKFGKWYYGDGEKTFGTMAIFKKVGEQHAKVHTKAREVAQTCKEGRKQEALAQFEEFGSITGTLFQLLDKMEQEVNKEEHVTA